MAVAARRRGRFVQPGATTPSGWRVLARALLSDDAGGRQDLWAVRAPDDEGRIAFFATCALIPLPRLYSWPEVERLLEVCRAQLGETERLLAAARAARSNAAEDAARGGDEHRVVEHDWLRATRWSEERRGGARVRLFDSQPVEAHGVVVLGRGGDADLIGVRARRLGALARAFDPKEMADRLVACSVWGRPLGDGQVWRRGRLRLEPHRVVFADEADAEDGTCGEPLRFGLPGGAAARDALEEDLLGSAPVRGKAEAGGVYAVLLAAALRGVRRRRRRDGALSSADGHARPLSAILAGMAGGEDERGARGLPADAVDEAVLADLRALGWEPLR